VPAAGLGELAFVRDGDIWILELDRGHEYRLTNDGQRWWPQWSADGKWLAFRKRERLAEGGETLTELWMVRANGSEGTKIADSTRSNIAWAPAGSRLAYVSDDGALSVMDADGGNQRKVLDGLPGGWFGYYGVVDWDQMLDWHR